MACASVATAVRAIRGIADTVILSGAMSHRGCALIAFCVPEAGFSWETAALRKACLERLPPRAIPDEFVFLPALPRLPSGKIDRMALRRDHMIEQTETDVAIS